MKHIGAVIGFLAGAAFASADYHLNSKFPIPGDGGWDYLIVDEAARRLYVSHGTEVNVLDADKGTLVGKVAGTKGVHGIALVPEYNRGFASNGETNDVTVFDLKTLEEVGRVPAGRKPDAIIYDPSTKLVIVNNGGSGSSTIIRAADAKVTGTIPLGGAPEFAAADGRGKVFVNLEDKSEVVKIDPAALKVDARWPLAPCESPSSMGIDRAARRLFIGCRNRMMAVVDADTGKVLSTAPIGDHVDATAYDAVTKLVFFANMDGTTDIFREDSPNRLTPVQKLTTERGAKTLALDSKTHRIFLSVAEREGRVVRPGTFHVLVYGQ